MRPHVGIATAAMILAQVLAGGPMPQTAIAGGGRAQAGEPILVGERGPEVFVPSAPGTVLPAQPPAMTVLPRGAPMKADPRLVPASATDYWDALERNGLLLNESAWDRWLANAPMSENIEDRRGVLGMEPRGTPSDWLKDQESQWLKAYKKHSSSAAKQ
jgi:hypothetical protein